MEIPLLKGINERFSQLDLQYHTMDAGYDRYTNKYIEWANNP